SAGRAFLFSGATGLLLRTFDPPTPQAGDRFRATLAVDGSDLLVGAPGEGGSGAVHRFALATGQPLGVLRKDAPQPDDLFGAAVAVVGGRVLVGAPRDDAGTV